MEGFLFFYSVNPSTFQKQAFPDDARNASCYFYLLHSSGMVIWARRKHNNIKASERPYNMTDISVLLLHKHELNKLHKHVTFEIVCGPAGIVGAYCEIYGMSAGEFLYSGFCH